MARPKSDSPKTTKVFGVTREESEKIDKAHKAFMDKHCVKISLSDFIRSFLKPILK